MVFQLKNVDGCWFWPGRQEHERLGRWVYKPCF
jgi:hypothetical protein